MLKFWWSHGILCNMKVPLNPWNSSVLEGIPYSYTFGGDSGPDVNKYRIHDEKLPFKNPTRATYPFQDPELFSCS